MAVQHYQLQLQTLYVSLYRRTEYPITEATSCHRTTICQFFRLIRSFCKLVIIFTQNKMVIKQYPKITTVIKSSFFQQYSPKNENPYQRASHSNTVFAYNVSRLQRENSVFSYDKLNFPKQVTLKAQMPFPIEYFRKRFNI